MKKLLVLLFSILISLNSYGKTICIKADNVQKRNGFIYLPNQQEPFTGENLCVYSSNKQYSSKGKIKDGKYDGKWTKWYKNGQISSENTYKNGERDGKYTKWDENGQKKYERNYKDDECISGDC